MDLNTVDRPAPTRPAPARPARRDVVLALLPVAALAAALQWWPENGDQALFAQTASRMRDGVVYYRDFWDIKQPGVYWFYELGDLLGPGGTGARLLEGALALVAARLVLTITTDWGLRRTVRLTAPTLVLGPYLVYAHVGGVGQVEGLLNLLLVVALAATLPVGGVLRPGWAWFVGGLAVGAVPVLKTVYGPVPLLLVVPALLLSHRIDARRTRGRVGWGVLGAVLPGLVTLAYFAAHGALDLALRTTFQLPAQVTADPTAPGSVHTVATALVTMFALVGPLALVGFLSGLRRDDGRLLVLPLAGTAVLEFALALPQVPTPYRWLMEAVPLGLLAALGLERVLTFLDRTPSQRRLFVRALAGLGALALIVPTAHVPLDILNAPAGDRFGVSERARIVRGQGLPPMATRPVAAAALMAGRIPPGTPVFILGDPRIATLLQTVPATEISGWTIGLPDGVWAELGRELNRTRPRFVYVDARDWSSVRQGAGAPVFDLLAERYRVVAANAQGTWYETSDVGIPLPEPGGNQLFTR
ncbi:hypothetical protein ACIB24_16650 [Spongisporangium articulatum]|uniref:4-amino-4-deoxy-L-arabinose transferase n=1 Tax=Spongisporangium articulatum TaxID=3362603 RepID=A0ABW8AQQ1_9ACTN